MNEYEFSMEVDDFVSLYSVYYEFEDGLHEKIVIRFKDSEAVLRYIYNSPNYYSDCRKVAYYILNNIKRDIFWTKRKDGDDGYVYLIKLPIGYYKIGKSKTPKKRMNIFSVKFPMNFEVIHLFESKHMSYSEAFLHDMFLEKRITGEWFILEKDDVNFIKSLSYDA